MVRKLGCSSHIACGTKHAAVTAHTNLIRPELTTQLSKHVVEVFQNLFSTRGFNILANNCRAHQSGVSFM